MFIGNHHLDHQGRSSYREDELCWRRSEERNAMDGGEFLCVLIIILKITKVPGIQWCEDLIEQHIMMSTG